jgi:predicted HTH domain antitoxin
MTTVHVLVAVPSDDQTSQEVLAGQVRLVWILDLVRRGRLSVGKGAELAGVDRWRFLEIMAEHRIPVMAYSASDLDRELAQIERP